MTSKTYFATDFGLYDGHSCVLQGFMRIISTIFSSESNRIPANGISVFFIQNEYVQTSSNINNIQLLSDIDSLYISHNWRDVSVSAISILKHLSLQHIFGYFGYCSSYLNMRKYVVVSIMIKVIQIIIIDDFFIFYITFVNYSANLRSPSGKSLGNSYWASFMRCKSIKLYHKCLITLLIWRFFHSLRVTLYVSAFFVGCISLIFNWSHSSIIQLFALCLSSSVNCEVSLIIYSFSIWNLGCSNWCTSAGVSVSKTSQRLSLSRRHI